MRPHASISASRQRPSPKAAIPNFPSDVFEAYAAEVDRILVDRPSAAAVADALARRLESTGNRLEIEAAAWLATRLRE